MIEPESMFPNSREKIDKSLYHPQRSLVILIAGIFFAEVMAMIVLYYVNPRQYWIETLLDASIMVLLIFPILYYFHVRPLYIQTTERKRSEALLRKVLENLPVGVWIIDQYGKILHGNQASLQIWGGARYVGMDQYGEYKAWNIDTGKPLRPDEWGAARAIQHGETVWEQELEIECFDGTHKLILNSAIPICDDLGKFHGVFVVNEDVTERKHAEQALIHSNELISRAFNSIDVLIAYMDRDFNFIQVNDTAAFNGHEQGAVDPFHFVAFDDVTSDQIIGA